MQLLTHAAIATMNDDAIVFALANPMPEVDPTAAAQHATVVATGRSDFANQINNVLVFPGVFRGLLDAASDHIDDAMLLAAAFMAAAIFALGFWLRQAQDVAPLAPAPPAAAAGTTAQDRSRLRRGSSSPMR